MAKNLLKCLSYFSLVKKKKYKRMLQIKASRVALDHDNFQEKKAAT